MRCSHEELVESYLRDLESDAEHAEKGFVEGRPDGDWAAYAAKLRAEIAQIKSAKSVRLDRYGIPFAAD